MTVFVPLATDPWTRFARGSKTVEVRNARSPVAAQVRKASAGAPVLLRLGYSGERNLRGTLGRIWEGRRASMPAWACDGADVDWTTQPGPFFDAAGPLLAFEVILEDARAPDAGAVKA